MLEKDSCSHTPKDVFLDSWDRNSNKEGIRLASNRTKISSDYFKSSITDTVGTEFCDGNPIVASNCAADNAYSYPLIEASLADNGLNFFENDCDDMESSNLLFYGLPDIVNFEDADRMFRSFDSRFGRGEVGNEDEYSWFSSWCIEGSMDGLKSDFKFALSESSAVKHVIAQDDPSKMSPHKKQTKLHNQSEGKLKEQHFDNSSSYCHTISRHFSGDSSHQVFNSSGIQEQREHLGPLSFYLQSETPYSQSGIMSESNGATTLTSLSLKESYYVSNGVTPMESIDNLDDKSKRQLYRCLNNTNCAGAVVQTASYNPTSVSTQVHDSQPENHFEIEGVRKRAPGSLDSSNVPESSCLSSELDAISLEASRFCQLQQVMQQLDLRTKLCIRDGLYRLARSADQRHHSASVNGDCRDEGDTNGVLLAEGTKESYGFMDIETDTNPVDRSIAHLLFHRSSDPSANFPPDGLSLKPNTTIHGSVSSPHAIAEKSVCQEQKALTEKGTAN